MFSYYLIFFLLLSLFYSLLILQYKDNLKPIDFIFLLLFIIIIVFRPIYLPDNFYYNNFYLEFNPQYFQYKANESLLSQELGFIYITKICFFLFGNNVKLFFLFISLINFFNFYLGSKLLLNRSEFQINKKDEINKKFSKIPYLFAPLFLFYISNYGILYNLVVLRAGLALSFLFLAVALLINNNRKAGLLVLLTSLFLHQTAIIGVLVALVVFLPTNISKKKYCISLGILLLLYILRIDLFIANFEFVKIFNLSDDKSENIYGSYLSIETTDGGYSTRILLLFLKLFIVIILGVENKIFRKLFNIVFCGLIILALGGGLPAFTRVSDFFIIFSFVLFYIFILQIKKKNLRNVLFVFFVFTEVIISLRAIQIFDFFDKN